MILLYYVFFCSILTHKKGINLDEEIAHVNFCVCVFAEH